MSLLTMTNIKKSFSGVEVLHGVELELREGEVLALIGENGAGKSTLMKILSGEERYDSGKIVLGGKEIEPQSPVDSLALGISMIHQELTPIPEMTVAENLFIGREPSKFGIVNHRKLEELASEQLQKLDLEMKPGAKVRELSISEVQEMEIAKVVSRGSRIVIMDEPTSSLTDSEIAKLFKMIKVLKEQKVSIIYISHKLEELFQIADRITVLRDGNYINTNETANTNRDQLIRDMVGRQLKDIFPASERTLGEVILEVKGLGKSKQFHDISFQLRRGEILGFFGLVGAGRTEMVSTIFGDQRADVGTVSFFGQEVTIKHPQKAIKHKVALVSEDRKLFGLNILASVKDNLLLVIQEKLTFMGILKDRLGTKLCEEKVSQLQIKIHSKDQLVGRLSGGNQQKVVLGKWLLSEPEIIILDEPTRGIDIGAKAEIYGLIQDLAAKGRGIILISSEMPEIIGLCDRMIVLHEGRATGELLRDEFEQERIMELASD
jgi:inositol transport system ATP-binding protein